MPKKSLITADATQVYKTVIDELNSLWLDGACLNSMWKKLLKFYVVFLYILQ